MTAVQERGEADEAEYGLAGCDGVDGLGGRASATLLGVTLTGDVYHIDEVTGAETLVGGSGFFVNSTARDPLSGTIYSASTQGLITIDPLSGAGSLIGSGGIMLSGLAFGPDGMLYGARNPFAAEGFSDRLVRVDPATGVQSDVGPFGGQFGAVQAMAFVDDTLYGWDLRATGGLFTVDLATGAATDLPAGTPFTQDMQGLATSADGTFLWGISRGAAGSLLTLDPLTGEQVPVGVPVTGVDFRGLEDLGVLVDPPGTPVPSPASLALAALALALLPLGRRRA